MAHPFVEHGGEVELDLESESEAGLFEAAPSRGESAAKTGAFPHASLARGCDDRSASSTDRK
jgi:hypothetical protein